MMTEADLSSESFISILSQVNKKEKQLIALFFKVFFSQIF
jgi:hypothetical protein